MASYLRQGIKCVMGKRERKKRKKGIKRRRWVAGYKAGTGAYAALPYAALPCLAFALTCSFDHSSSLNLVSPGSIQWIYGDAECKAFKYCTFEHEFHCTVHISGKLF